MRNYLGPKKKPQPIRLTKIPTKCKRCQTVETINRYCDKCRTILQEIKHDKDQSWKFPNKGWICLPKNQEVK